MRSLLVLVMGIMLCSCGETGWKRVSYYEEKGWVRQIWTGKWSGSGLDTYYLTFEREIPKGQIIQLLIVDSGAPTVWQGEHVVLKLNKWQWGTNTESTRLNLVEAQRVD